MAFPIPTNMELSRVGDGVREQKDMVTKKLVVCQKWLGITHHIFHLNLHVDGFIHTNGP